jgi:Zn-dependent peptidase ImmA (M78 family)
MISAKSLEKIISDQTRLGYNFQPGFINEVDLHAIRQATEKERYDIQKAPLGRRIFSFILEKHPEIHFEKGHFKSDFDAMIYFPNHDQSVVFIVFNQNKPLVNQIFACAHEYYHYLFDTKEISSNLFICQLDKPESVVREHKASRFAAELLLPREALKEIEEEFRIRNQSDRSNLPEVYSLISLTINLTLRFEMPVKAILYRLKEEGYYAEFLKSLQPIYDLIKDTISLLSKQSPERFHEIFDSKNSYLEDTIYNIAANVYNRGLVTYERLMEDMDRLGISMESLGLQPPVYDPGDEDDT